MKKLSEIVTGEALDAAEQIASDAKADPATKRAAAELVDLAGSYRQLYSKAKAAKKLDDPEVAPSLRGVAEKMRALDEFLRQPNAPKSLAASDAASGYGQRGIEGPANGGSTHPWAAQLVKRLDGKSIRDLGTFSVPVRALDLFETKAWPADAVSESTPDPRANEMARRARFVADLFGQRTVIEGQASYLRQTVRTNLATAVARHGAKPQSTYALERIEQEVRTIAHLSEPIAIQDLEDNAELERFIREELVLGLKLGLDTQVLSGDGLGANMTGLLTDVTETQAFATDAPTSVRKALTTLESRDVFADFIILTPADWEAIELVSIANSDHLSQQPVDRAERRLWSVPVYLSTGMTSGFALIGESSGARLAIRSEGRIDVSTSGDRGGVAGEDLFEFNEARFRAEMRAVIELLQEPKFIKADIVTP